MYEVHPVVGNMYLAPDVVSGEYNVIYTGIRGSFTPVYSLLFM